MQQRVVITKKRNSAEATIAVPLPNYVLFILNNYPNSTYHGECSQNRRIAYHQ